MAKEISLDKFAKGALKAQFNRELRKVSANVFDPNTSPTARRTIAILISVKPDEARELGDVEITTKSTLCPVKAVSTRLVFGYDEVQKEGVANELNAEMLGQVDLNGLEESVQKQKEELEAMFADKVIDLRN